MMGSISPKNNEEPKEELEALITRIDELEKRHTAFQNVVTRLLNHHKVLKKRNKRLLKTAYDQSSNQQELLQQLSRFTGCSNRAGEPEPVTTRPPTPPPALWHSRRKEAAKEDSSNAFIKDFLRSKSGEKAVKKEGTKEALLEEKLAKRVTKQ